MSNLKTVAKALPVAREPELAPEEPVSKDAKRQTFYLPLAVHDQFRDLSHAKRCSQQELFRRAADLLFAQEGLPSWGQLAPAKSKGEK